METPNHTPPDERTPLERLTVGDLVEACDGLDYLIGTVEQVTSHVITVRLGRKVPDRSVVFLRTTGELASQQVDGRTREVFREYRIGPATPDGALRAERLERLHLTNWSRFNLHELGLLCTIVDALEGDSDDVKR